MVSERLNSLAEQLMTMLPPPVRREDHADGTVLLIGGDPGEVMVRATRSSVTISIFAVRWEGPHLPVVDGKPVGRLAWHRLPTETAVCLSRLMIDAAARLRRAAFRRCRRC